jgi:hypothetical protein
MPNQQRGAVSSPRMEKHVHVHQNTSSLGRDIFGFFKIVAIAATVIFVGYYAISWLISIIGVGILFALALFLGFLLRGKRTTYTDDERALNDIYLALEHKTCRRRGKDPDPNLDRDEQRTHLILVVGAMFIMMILALMTLVFYATEESYQFFPMNYIGLAAVLSMLVLICDTGRKLFLMLADKSISIKDQTRLSFYTNKACSGITLAYMAGIVLRGFGII